MNKEIALKIQIVLDALMVICCIVDAALDKQIHPLVCLLWVLIALFAHIENLQIVRDL